MCTKVNANMSAPPSLEYIACAVTDNSSCNTHPGVPTLGKLHRTSEALERERGLIGDGEDALEDPILFCLYHNHTDSSQPESMA